MRLITCWVMMMISMAALRVDAQTNEWQFQIKDESGINLVGANVYNQNAKIFETSDVQGSVLISHEDKSILLTVSYLGYQTQQLRIENIIDNDGFVYMKEEALLMEGIEVIGRNNERQIEIPFQVETLSKDFIKSSNSQNSADVLEKSGQVFIQKSQMGGGSPILRGFEANKILLVIDGVRMNNAIYRSGHLQNAISVDHQSLERLELIFGPGSLNYGSDAIGGVIHFRTINPILKSNRKLNNSFSYQFNSANLGSDIGAQVHLGRKENIAFLTSLKLSNYNNLRSGKRKHKDYPTFGNRDWYVTSEYPSIVGGEIKDTVLVNENNHIQRNSSYTQMDLLQKMLWQINTDDQFIANLQVSVNSNTNRYDQLTEGSFEEPSFASWSYRPQNRVLFSTQYLSLKERKYTEQINIIAAYQKITEGRFNRRFGALLSETQLEELNIFSLTADLTKIITPRKHIINYGIESNFNFLASSAYSQNVRFLKFYDILTRYPSGDNRVSSFGGYVNYKWHLSPVTIFNGGMRYTYSNTYISYSRSDVFEWPEYFYDGIKNNNGSIVGSLGINSNWESGWKMRFMVANAFRNPNIDDLAKVRIRGNNVSVPNPDLGPEQSYSADFSIGKNNQWSDHSSLEWSINTFYTYLTNAIIRDDFQLPDGSKTYEVNDLIFNVQANVNADEAFARGVSGNLVFNYNDIQFQSSLSYTKGTSKNKEGLEQPLAHIPPFYGKVKLAYELNNNDFSFDVKFNGWKHIEDYALGSSDNEDQATIDGSPSWYTLNAYYSRKFGEKNRINLACENILDLHYRTFSSGISAPGRNWVASYTHLF